MASLRLEWGTSGLKSALQRNDNIVIIDQLRFSSTVVTAISFGFTIEPTNDGARRTESYSLSPRSFFNKTPGRVIIASPNGAFLSINAKNAKRVVYGSILNAKATAEYIDALNEDATLIAAGEVDQERIQFMQGKELDYYKTNNIFATEDFLAAGAIAHFSRMEKSKECIEAHSAFEEAKDRLLETMQDTASHRYNVSTGKGEDTLLCCRLNAYNVVPKLHFSNGIPEIRAD